MRLYRFEVREELITRIEVVADTEQEARDSILVQGHQVTTFDTVHSELRLELRSVRDV